MDALRVTLDTNQLDESQVARIARAVPAAFGPVHVWTVTVNVRERRLTGAVPALVDPSVWSHVLQPNCLWAGTLAEPLVLDESRFDEGRLVTNEEAVMFEAALKIVSNGSFPRPVQHAEMSAGHRRHLRDAMTFLAHAAAGHDVLISSDSDLTGPRTGPCLQQLGGTWLITPEQFVRAARDHRLGELRSPP